MWRAMCQMCCNNMGYRCLCLSVFTGKSKEAEIKRINKELANIRSKFKGMFSVVCVSVCLQIPGQQVNLTLGLAQMLTSRCFLPVFRR